ncbi:hypothetical protein AB0A77_30840 [Streptomyces varsoviensis]|uniref:hypothetical protein n=1 Tax=Streptomyces varsoviensis TaxID=67373 RepID=UPI00340EEBAE
MKYTKAAAVVAGSLMALGTAAPAFAAGAQADAQPGQATAGPLKGVDVRGLVGAVDELGSAFDRTKGNEGDQGNEGDDQGDGAAKGNNATDRPITSHGNPAMVGGLPLGTALGS